MDDITKTDEYFATAQQAVEMMNELFIEFDQPAIASFTNGSISIDTDGKADRVKVAAIMDAVFDVLEGGS